MHMHCGSPLFAIRRKTWHTFLKKDPMPCDSSPQRLSGLIKGR